MTFARGSGRTGRWSGSSLFEAALSVPAEEAEFLLSGTSLVPWAEYVLNPRRLRGSDFLMRWSQGQWSEERVVQAVNDTGKYFALPYGPSGTAPEGDVREFELYFERLEKAGLGKMKRPDLLIFRTADRVEIENLVDDLGGLKELPFTRENDPRMVKILARAIVATECESVVDGEKDARLREGPNTTAEACGKARVEEKRRGSYNCFET